MALVEVYLNYIPVGRVVWSRMVEPSLRIRGARIPNLGVVGEPEPEAVFAL